MDAPKDATAATRAALAQAAAALPPEDGADFERVRRGFIDTLPDARIESPTRGVAWDLSPFAFEQAEAAPDTVHPGLWRQARLNLNHGLFRVTDGVYQVRGFDISNVTFIEGETGYVVIDPLTTAEPAAAALALMRKHRGDKPVTAVIYTHSHVDHYGGVMGVLTEADIAAGARIIAPEGFLIEAVSENVLLGNVMNRRATYMYGALLPRGPRGHVDAGLGKAVSLGQPALVAPTESIVQTGTRLSIDGVEAVFQVTPGTEAPAEMNFYFPKLRALCMAENCTCCLHNLYTPRGAQVRDAKAWSYYIDEALALFGDEADVLFASHHWPRWGREDAARFLTTQRDLYKYVHDQTLRLANHGLTPKEIAEELALPPTLAGEWHTRGYYGTLNHNAKAVYQRYLGWFDGNPAGLHPLPPVDAGQALRRARRRGRGAARQGARSVRGRRLSLGGRGGEPPGVRRPGQRGGPRAAGRCAGAARLPGRVRPVARLLSDRRAGAAEPPRPGRRAAPGRARPTAAPAGRLPAGCAERAPERSEGGRYGAEAGGLLQRHRRALPDRARERRHAPLRGPRRSRLADHRAFPPHPGRADLRREAGGRGPGRRHADR